MQLILCVCCVVLACHKRMPRWSVNEWHMTAQKLLNNMSVLSVICFSLAFLISNKCQCAVELQEFLKIVDAIKSFLFVRNTADDIIWPFRRELSANLRHSDLVVMLPNRNSITFN